MTVINKKMFIENLVIGTLFSVVFIYILSAIQMYFGYITSSSNKELFLIFSTFVVIGLTSLGTTLCIKENKYLTKPFVRLIKALLIVLTLISFLFAALYSSLAVTHIISFFEFLLTRIKAIDISYNVLYLFTLLRLEYIVRLTNISNLNFIFNIIVFITVGIIAISSLKEISKIKTVEVKEEETNKEDITINNNIFGFENFVSKKLKRKLAFGYIYKVLP